MIKLKCKRSVQGDIHIISEEVLDAENKKFLTSIIENVFCFT